MEIYNNYQNIDKCIVTLRNGKQYKKISDVLENEYLDIHGINNMPVEILKKEEYFFKIENFLNLKHFCFDFENWSKLEMEPILNKIALFQKLSIYGIIDYHKMSYSPIKTGYFIWENKMTVINPKILNFGNIPSTVEYLNIISLGEFLEDYVNLPDTIQHLHLSLQSFKNYKQTNLPFGLKTVTITISSPDIDKTVTEEINFIIISNTKLPFNCELIIDDIYTNKISYYF